MRNKMKYEDCARNVYKRIVNVTIYLKLNEIIKSRRHVHCSKTKLYLWVSKTALKIILKD